MAVCSRCGSALLIGRKQCDVCERSAGPSQSSAAEPAPSHENQPPLDAGGPASNPADPTQGAGGEIAGISGPPPAAPAGSPRRPRWPLVLLAIALFLGLSGVGAAAAVMLGVFNAGPAIDRMVPSTTDVYAVVYLDPPLGQKVNLLNMVHKFPELKTDQDLNKKVDDTVDKAFKEAGLSFSADVRPWLGSRLGLIAQVADNAPAALLIDSRNETKARAALAKVRNSEEGRKLSWNDSKYRGVTISVGTPTGGNSHEPLAYAYVDHTVVVSNSEALVHDVIDTDQGKKARLLDSPGYKAIAGQVPAERLALLFVNGKPVIDRLKAEIAKQGQRGVQVPKEQLDQLDAFKGLTLTLAARSNGLAADLQIKMDPSKLDAETRDALISPSHKNTLLQWVPRQAYGLFAATTLKQGLQSYVNQSATSSPEARQSLDQFGLTGRNGLLAHLTGDVAIEVEAGAGRYPAGALLLATDNEAVMRTFLDRLEGLAMAGLDRTSIPGNYRIKHEGYRGVSITSLSIPQLAEAGLVPAYAVTGGVGIVASSSTELRALIDAHQSGQNITTAENFMAASKEADQNPSSEFYVDISQGALAVRGLLPDKERKEYDVNVAPDLDPLKAFIMTAENGSDQISERIFVLIP